MSDDDELVGAAWAMMSDVPRQQAVDGALDHQLGRLVGVRRRVIEVRISKLPTADEALRSARDWHESAPTG